jgi:hypothetical protein
MPNANVEKNALTRHVFAKRNTYICVTITLWLLKFSNVIPIIPTLWTPYSDLQKVYHIDKFRKIYKT